MRLPEQRCPRFQYGISHSIVFMNVNGWSVEATFRVHWLKSPEQIDKQYLSRTVGTRTALSNPLADHMASLRLSSRSLLASWPLALGVREGAITSARKPLSRKARTSVYPVGPAS